MRRYRFVLLFFLLNLVTLGDALAQVVFIPPYVRFSLTYYDGGEQRITERPEEEADDNGLVYEQSVSLENFGARLAYGVFTSHQTRLQVEGSFLFWQNNSYEWRDPSGENLALSSLKFTNPGTTNKVSLLLSGYYDFDRLNPYANASWTPYVGGGLGVYALSRPVFDVNLTSSQESADTSVAGGTVVDAIVLGSGGEDTGRQEKIVIYNEETALSVGPLAALEAGVSYNFNNYIVEGYGRAEYVFSLRNDFPSELILTLNFGIRL